MHRAGALILALIVGLKLASLSNKLASDKCVQGTPQLVERPARATANEEGLDEETLMSDFIIGVTDDIDSCFEFLCSESSESEGGHAEEPGAHDSGDSSDDIAKVPKASKDTWTFYRNTFFTFSQNPAYDDVKVRAHPTWCKPGLLEIYNMSKAVRFKDTGETIACYERAFAVARAWMLHKVATTNESTQLPPWATLGFALFAFAYKFNVQKQNIET